MGEEAVGAAADDLGDRLERRSRRQTLRHNGRYSGAWPRQGLREMRKRALQAEPYRVIVGCGELVGCSHQRTGKVDPRGKTANTCYGIARQYRLLVLKAQSVTQLQHPGQTIFLDLVTLDHLWLGRPIRIDAESVEDEICVIACRPRAGNDRVEDGQIGGRDENQLAGLLRPSEPRRGKRGEARAGGFEQVSSAHHDFLPTSVTEPK